MAKKSKKVEKETRRLIEGISDLVKKGKAGKYKFKGKHKKKVIKQVKRTCVHWIYRKGKEVPTVTREGANMWRCQICGAVFPVSPEKPEVYNDVIDRMIQYVNQMQFWSVKLGGNADDTRMFLKLKENLPRFKKVTKQIRKRIDQRQAYENNRENSDIISHFALFGGFDYRR